ncbi:MAG: zinc metallopeptidase [Eubacteriales bacterium]|nr:zinc metallopeptidase [Eubacteriales bacterium]
MPMYYGSYYYGYSGLSPLYFLALLAIFALALFAQIKVKTNFTKYSAMRCSSGFTGAQAAQRILQANGVTNIRIEAIPGELTDHFDPATNVIRLSERVYGASTVAAVGVAAHEAGHAVQYATGYAPIRLRSAIIGATNFASKWSILLFIAGLLLCAVSQQLIIVAYIGFFLYCMIAFFQLVTLPVEFNASHRALRALQSSAILTDTELRGARNVLSAAALTYVASMLTTLLQVFRIFTILLKNDRN